MKFRNMLISMLIPVMVIQVAFAGTTGKISGRVTDASTGEQLVGVNVFIKGTNLGAAADLEGQYYIINVPVGIYSVQAQYIGYTLIEIQEVQVNADLTTTLDIEMSTEII